MPSVCLDHLVIAAESLEQGAKYIRNILGVEMQVGGQHPQQGTHNLLLKLDHDRYLEVIAIDPSAPKPKRPRWFDLDSPSMQAKLQDRPRLITWAARTNDIQAAVRKCTVEIGQVRQMSRGELNWQITIPQGGSLPFDGLAPALIEWDTEQHPANSLPESSCQLVALEGYYNQPERIQTALALLSLEKEIMIHVAQNISEIGLKAKLATPSGIIILD